MPKVSVILSSYNHAKYLAASIQSVLDQTFTDFELLIFDDGSSDNSQEIIRSFDDERIKLFLYEKNRGSYHAIKEPLKFSRGKYLAFQHSDDIWEPDKLFAQVEFLDANPQYAACFTQVQFIDETGELYDLPDEHPYKLVFKKANRSREEWLNNLFWNSNCFCNPSVVFRNEPENLVMNPYLWQLPDFYMWLKLCQRANVYVLERELIRFRLRREAQNSVSSLSLEKSIRVANEAYFTAREFFALTSDAAEFLKIFPEAQEFLIGGEILPEFALAKLCLRHHLPAYKNLGLEKLYDLLDNLETAEIIKKLYNYDEKIFIQDTGANDVFGVKVKVPLLHSRLYIDFGDGFNETDSLCDEVQIGAGGAFAAEFSCPLKSPVKMLRFDPDDKNLLFVRISKILVNGVEVADFSSNAQEILDGGHLFFSADPWFTINCEVHGENLGVEILGVVEKNPAPLLEKIHAQTRATIQNQAAEINQLNATINQQNAAINQLNAAINQQNAEINQLNAEINRLTGEIHSLNELNIGLAGGVRWFDVARKLRAAKKSVKKILG